MAEMIPAQVHQDILDIGKAVNTDAVITPRYGAPFKSLPMLARETYADIVDLRTNKADKTEVAAKIEVETMRAQAAEQALQNQVNAVGVGNKAYLTYAEMDVDKANNPVNSKLEVTNDPVAENNGTYQWNGTTLTKSVYDPVQLSKLNAASLSVVGDYLTETSKREIASLSESSSKYLIAKAIKKVAITNPISGKKYKISSVFKNSNTGSRIVINDDTGAVASIIVPVETIVSGLQEYSLTGIRNAKVLIDWDVLQNGTEATALDLYFNNDVYYQEYLSSANISKNTTDLLAVKNTVIPDWLVKEQASAVFDSANALIAMKAIKGVEITGATSDMLLRLVTVAKNDANFGSRIFINNAAGTLVLQYLVASSVVKSGIETVQLQAQNSSGLSGTITINWDLLPNGVVNLGSASPLLIKWDAVNSAVDKNLEKVNKVLAPTWLEASYADSFSTQPDVVKKTALAIKGVEITGATSDMVLRFSAIAKQDDTYATRIFISNGSTIVCRLDVAKDVEQSGLKTITVPQSGGSGVSALLTIDWDEVPLGLMPSSGSNLYINKSSRDYAKSKVLSEKNTLDIAVLQSEIGNATGASKLPTKPYRVAIAGSSITWGQGYLGEGSYVGIVEQILRNQYAKTIHASTIAPTATTLSGNDFYLGSAKRINGLNSEVSFNLDGDELSLSVARERENTGACLVELYVDNVLYDTFDTSTKPSVSRTENFTGNGSTIKFNLDGCFTYDHAVTVGGVLKAGKVNTQGSGASIPASDDYMIIRRYDGISNQVVHVLWFKEAPTGAIVVTYKQGENIRHLKGTIDRSGAGFTSTLESTYGDGSTSYDPANPSAVSSGFGFRESDNRSVKTWKFSESKTRSYKLKIKALHSSATGATPYLDLNFVTNRMHHIMNAGIGGWEAREFISSPIKINMIDEVINFNPDIVLIESCTNDDWSTGLFKAHVVRSGLTAAQILAEPTANYFTAISGTASNKTANDVRIPMTAITSNTITLAPDVVDTNIAVGDVVVIGDYGCNHQRVAVRVIKAYDSATKTITLNRSISDDEFYQAESLNDLLSEFVMIYNAPNWVNQNKQLVEMIESALPDCKITIATAGIPHFYLRKLFGYREIAQKVAKDNHIGFVDYYDATFDYQYSQQLSTHQTITSTGASEYTLTGSAHTFPNPKVFVNGVEHKKVRITGGLTKHWADTTADPTMSNTSNSTKPFKLIFDADIPASGAIITIHKSTIAWAGDYCHPSGPQGYFVVGQAASKILKDVN
ncbi:hypothetical protein [Acinetobacter sp. YH12029]|uniref:hypothetical protein n=1 Tax=Acinetobacter sp. YH12029 TaxID=2601044 RepID=UPI0015D3E961|nr:hypothetical protein [Acinetobacter sp. YH12029]